MLETHDLQPDPTVLVEILRELHRRPHGDPVLIVEIIDVLRARGEPAPEAGSLLKAYMRLSSVGNGIHIVNHGDQGKRALGAFAAAISAGDMLRAERLADVAFRYSTNLRTHDQSFGIRAAAEPSTDKGDGRNPELNLTDLEEGRCADERWRCEEIEHPTERGRHATPETHESDH